MLNKFIPENPTSPNMKCSIEKYSVFLVGFLFLISAAFVSKAQTIWNAGMFEFVKTDPSQGDQITANTRLTRGFSGPLFNSVTEPEAGHTCTWTPGNTQWAFGNISNWNNLTYQNLWTILTGCNGGGIPTSITSGPLVCRLLTENIYLQITFTYWQMGGGNNTPQGPGDFSYTRTISSTLPVLISKFSGRKTGNMHLLNWTSSTENNFSHYNIQRSANGIDFISLGRVDSKSNGYSSTDQDYSYTDVHPAPGHNFYRLEQVDKDGKTQYSKVIDLFNSNNGSTIDIRQNDGGNLISIHIAAVKSSGATIKLVDMNGRIMKTINKGIENGNNIVPVNLDNLAKGIYIVQVYEDGKLSFTGKVIRQL